MTYSLSDRIVKHLQGKDFICGGEIQKLAAEIGFEPQNAGRRLRELAHEGILEVEYRKGKNKVKVAWYRYKTLESYNSHSHD